MDAAKWYAIALGGSVALFVCICFLLFMIRCLCYYGTFYFLRVVYYRQVILFTWVIPYFDLLLLMLFLAVNAFCLRMAIKVKTIPEFLKKSGLIAIVNLMPLYLGSRMNLIGSLCGVGLETYSRIHRWLGRTVIITALIHVTVAAASTKINLQTRKDVCGLAVSIIFAIIMCSRILRKHFYEIYVNLHFLFVVCATIGLYLHIMPGKIYNIPAVYLLAAVCLQIAIIVLQAGQIIHRNIKYGTPITRIAVRKIIYQKNDRLIPVLNAVQVYVQVCRPWRPRAGQYVYLCIPGVSKTSFIQSHPFYVCWYFHGSTQDHIILIVRLQDGITKHLKPLANPPLTSNGDAFRESVTIRGFIEGPYGRELHLEDYGTVVLFASGIGITGQLPYAKQLVDGYQSAEVKAKKVALYWEVESELDTAWLTANMQGLLDTDKKSQILDIHIFVTGGMPASTCTDEDWNLPLRYPGTGESDFGWMDSHKEVNDFIPLGRRLKMVKGAMDARQLIEDANKTRQGRMVVSMCVDDVLRTKIKSIIRELMDSKSMDNRSIRIEELDFRPGFRNERKE